jgi:hypothetical protein
MRGIPVDDWERGLFQHILENPGGVPVNQYLEGLDAFIVGYEKEKGLKGTIPSLDSSVHPPLCFITIQRFRALSFHYILFYSIEYTVNF